jgi:Protein of unknown function (DUF2845)
MNIKWIFWGANLALVLGASPAFAWRCEHGFADTGDTNNMVRKKCGHPDFIYTDTGVYRAGRFIPIDEYWYYNYGPNRLLRALRFHSGVLQAVDTLGYGFRPGAHRCTPQDIRIGMSAFELLNGCGRPKSRRKRFTRLKGTKRSSGKVVIHTEIWTYDFGSQYLLQKVAVSGGQVQSRETTSRALSHSKRRH